MYNQLIRQNVKLKRTIISVDPRVVGEWCTTRMEERSFSIIDIKTIS